MKKRIVVALLAVLFGVLMLASCAKDNTKNVKLGTCTDEKTCAVIVLSSDNTYTLSIINQCSFHKEFTASTVES